MEKGKVVEIVDAGLEPIIPRFLRNTGLELERMHRALAEKDYQKLQLLGHRAKGAGFGYGFQRMGEVGKSIEDAARKQDVAACAVFLETLAEYLENLEVHYE